MALDDGVDVIWCHAGGAEGVGEFVESNNMFGLDVLAIQRNEFVSINHMDEVVAEQ